MSKKVTNKVFFTVVIGVIAFSIYFLYQRVFIRQDFIIQEQ